MKYKLLIIVPARKSSKEVKNKNLIKINNKPLIYYSIKAAKFVKETSKIIFCSTDSKKIKNAALNFGAEVPFLRPKNISSNLSRDIEFVNHALKKYSEANIIFKYGLILRPTSPIRKKISLNSAYNRFKKYKFAHSMRAVTPSLSNPYRTWIFNKKVLKPVANLKLKEFYNAPRQILPRTFWQEKPIGSGSTLAHQLDYIFPGVSMPLIGEGYVNFGIIGSLLFMLLFGVLLGNLDRIAWKLKKINKCLLW